MTYLQFFQQGISGNPALRERLARDPKLSRDLLSLFIYGVHGQSYGAPAKNNLEVPG